MTYQAIVEKKNYAIGPINTLVYLCSTHFLKNVKDEGEIVLRFSDKDLSAEILNLFVKAFCILQNSVCLDTFLNILNSLKIVFTSKTKSIGFLNSYANLIMFTNQINLEMFSHICDSCKNIGNDDEFYEKKSFFFIDNKNVSFVKDSPFTDFFNRKIRNQVEMEGNEINLFFNPKLYEIIKKRLHILPLWSGLIFKHFGIEKTRLSNNYVEKWFHHLKINIIHRNKKVNRFQPLNPSEFCIPVYYNLKRSFSEFYEDTFNIRFPEFESKRKMYLKENLTFEKWSTEKKKESRISDKNNNFENDTESRKIRDMIKNIKISEIGFIDKIPKNFESALEGNHMHMYFF